MSAGGRKRTLHPLLNALSDQENPVTKMDMVWIAVASLIHPEVNMRITVGKEDIDRMVQELFKKIIIPVMINRHLVNSEDRQADVFNPQRGGSRIRYLYRDDVGRFRLYKNIDHNSDGWEKTGRTCPEPDNVTGEFRHLIDWYRSNYINS